MDYSKKDLYTPMMQQYLTIKEQNQDSILFFRLGDFYEMFFDDALLASRELEIALTGKSAGTPEKVPMCGVPFHSAATYIERLVEKGFKVSICEQVEEASASKGLVKRDVVKIITPGTVLDENFLDEKNNNYICSLDKQDNKFVISYTDITTGEMFILFIDDNISRLNNEILELNTKELIVSPDFDLKIIHDLIESQNIIISYSNTDEIPKFFESLYDTIDDSTGYNSYKLLINYILKTQKINLNHLQEVIRIDSNSFMSIDVYSKKNLELTETLRNSQKKNSLLWFLDSCSTAMGSRMLKKWIDRPLIDESLIKDRHEAIETFINNVVVLEELRELLKSVYDLERIVGRIASKSVNAKDLLNLKRSLSIIPEFKKILLSLDNINLSKYSNQISEIKSLYKLIDDSIIDNPSMNLKEGNLIKPGFNSELDELTNAKNSGKDFLKNFEAEERVRTGIKSLKVGFNKVFGYFIEITKSNLHLVKEEYGYERKQTLSNAERFITPLLKEKESLILNASDKIINIEYELFLSIRKQCSSYIRELQYLADNISNVDCLLSLSIVSYKNGFIRPILANKVVIKEGFHPVIKKISQETFITNDLNVQNDQNLFLITGPNMAGKSTYMRMIAVISIINQIGCFVPAKSATLKVFDKVFTRIGASDDLVSGKSTFMVEMIEVNNALTNATKDSLIIFDEIGRGTATYDGMALAQAIIEYIHEKINCLTLFSTHYHELTILDKTLRNLVNIHVSAKEERGNITFLYKVKAGAIDKSYGINVASLAKLPKGLIKRSKDVLNSFESNDNKKILTVDLFNFDDVFEEEKNEVSNNEIDVLNQLNAIDINSLTPLDALGIIQDLQSKLK